MALLLAALPWTSLAHAGCPGAYWVVRTPLPDAAPTAGPLVVGVQGWLDEEKENPDADEAASSARMRVVDPGGNEVEGSIAGWGQVPHLLWTPSAPLTEGASYGVELELLNAVDRPGEAFGALSAEWSFVADDASLSPLASTATPTLSITPNASPLCPADSCGPLDCSAPDGGPGAWFDARLAFPGVSGGYEAAGYAVELRLFQAADPAVPTEGEQLGETSSHAYPNEKHEWVLPFPNPGSGSVCAQITVRDAYGQTSESTPCSDRPAGYLPSWQWWEGTDSATAGTTLDEGAESQATEAAPAPAQGEAAPRCTATSTPRRANSFTLLAALLLGAAIERRHRRAAPGATSSARGSRSTASRACPAWRT